MSVNPSSILKDNTLSSVAVTQLFKGGELLIRNGQVDKIIAEIANIEDLKVTHLIVNGTVSGGVVSNKSLGLLPGELVATNSLGAPISFPYGNLANEIAIRDASGSASFTSWTAPVNDTQLFVSTGSGLGIVFLFANIPGVDSVISVPDVGGNGVLVTLANNGGENVLVGQDNIMTLQSTGGQAALIVEGNVAAGSRASVELGVAGTTYAKIIGETDTSNFSIRDANDIVRFSVVPSLGPLGTINFGLNLVPATDGAWGVGNTSTPGFEQLFTTITTGINPDLTSGFSLNLNTALNLILNSASGTSLAPQASVSLTWTNSLITTSTKFICSISGLSGGVNAATIGVPYVFISNVVNGSCQINTANVGSQTSSTPFSVHILLLP